jgi:hypothetical protein
MIWVGLAVFNYGAVNADLEWRRHHKWGELHLTFRDDVGFLVGQTCLLPPVEFVTSLIATNFLQHGWHLEAHD